ncbi:unnamed protein product, partial [Staurois parvus]
AVLTSLAVFPSVARGKVSAPQAVHDLHSGIPCSVAPGSLLHLPCPALPRCPPAVFLAMSSDRCRHLSSVPCDIRMYGDGTGGKC